MSQSFSFLSGLSVLPSTCDRVLEFSGDEVPSEIQALGPPERVHRPNPLLASLVSCRYVVAMLVVAGAAALGTMLYQDLQQKGQLDHNILFVFAVLGGLALFFVVVLARLPVTKATVFFYPRAAVVAEGDKLTLIPWKQLLFAKSRISTPDGREFYCGWLERFDRFEERIWELTAEHWLPDALTKVKAGETVTVGELAVSKKNISYQGKTAAWEEVDRLVIVVGRYYQLNISTNNASWSWWAEVKLHEVPNARSMEQLISSICPQHLLTRAE